MTDLTRIVASVRAGPVIHVSLCLGVVNCARHVDALALYLVLWIKKPVDTEVCPRNMHNSDHMDHVAAAAALR